MENTSKALLIAAAVLIAILLIAFGIKIFSSSSHSGESAEDTGKTISQGIEVAMSSITGESTSNKTTQQFSPIEEIEPQNTEYQPGKEVTYNNNKYIILYNNKTTVQMVTKEPMGNLELGRLDTAYYGRGIDSYNNAISRLNQYCESLINPDKNDNNIISVRSIGSNPQNMNSENSAVYTKNGIDDRLNGVAKSTDYNYEDDLTIMSNLKIGGCLRDYWLASRVIKETQYGVSFCIRTVNGQGVIGEKELFGTYLWTSVQWSTPKAAVRPVVTIKTSALNLN